MKASGSHHSPFVRIVAGILALLLLATVFSVLLLR